MKTRAAIILLALAISFSLPAFAANAPSNVIFKGGSGSGSVISGNMDVGRYIIDGRAHVQFEDALKKTGFSSDAAKITIQLYTSAAKSAAKGLDAIKRADFSGPVKIVYTSVVNGAASKTIATADSATFTGSDKLAHLKGNVHITHEDPSTLGGPAVMTGDQATINLNPNLGPDDFRFRVESSPGVSTVTVTPKADITSKDKKK